MELKDIISKITVNKEWHDRYCKLVPKFIESAKTCENWQDWDKSVFYEFLKKTKVIVSFLINKISLLMRKKKRSRVIGNI